MIDEVDLRHRFHQIAERSGAETKTRALIFCELSSYAPTRIIESQCGNHLIAEFDSGNLGRTILLRADFDAVGVAETDSLPYHSENPGVAHKCGHDGHTVILLSVARALHKNPINSGKVLLLFQAAEETGAGAQQVINEQLLANYSIDYAFALHNIPEQPLGTILCNEGSFSCSVISCEILLQGTTSHASEPLKAVSPLSAAMQITETLLADNCYDLSSKNCKITTLVELHVGTPDYGVTAGEGAIRLTLRARTDERLKQEMKRVESVVAEEVAKIQNLKSSINWLEYFAANENHPNAVNIVKSAAQNLQLQYIEKTEPYSWGEDFGLFTQKYVGAMFGVGAGVNCLPLHHPNYDFPDSLLRIGKDLFLMIIKLSLK